MPPTSPIPVTPSDTDAAILADVIATLQQLTVDGTAVFDRVIAVVDAAEFTASNDPMAQTVAAVIANRSERRYGTDNGMETMARLTLPVIVQVPVTVGPDLDATQDLSKLDRLVDLVRAGLRVDPTRGGLAARLLFAGQWIDGTSIDGQPKPLRDKKRGITVGVEVPVVVAWIKDY